MAKVRSEVVERLPNLTQRGTHPVYIALMGLSGSGKSTFINLASNSKFETSEQLESCTQDVQMAPEFQLDGRNINLIDTPGFDDTDKSEVEILRLITTFLADQYKDGTRLHGVIYVHRICDMKMGGIATRTLRVFKDFCGDHSLKNVVIVTNMWAKVTLEEGEIRERQLRDDTRYFNPLLTAGATMRRHNNTLESAHEIIRQISSRGHASLNIQTETVDDRKSLRETSAGISLRSLLLESAGGLQVAMTSVWDALKTAADGGDERRTELELDLEEKVLPLARIRNEITNLDSVMGTEKIDVLQAWNRMNSRARITTLLRRCYGKDDHQDKTAFWFAMGDTTKVIRDIYTVFQEHPLSISVRSQLLEVTSVLDKADKEKFDKWLSVHGTAVKEIETIMGRAVKARAKLLKERAGGKTSRIFRRVRSVINKVKTVFGCFPALKSENGEKR